MGRGRRRRGSRKVRRRRDPHKVVISAAGKMAGRYPGEARAPL